MQRRVRILFSSATLVALGACTAVGPDYVVPIPETPDLWANELEGALSPDPAVLAVWWEQLEDPLLNDLIERAFTDNKDLALTFSRVNEARALRGIAHANLLPDVNVNGNAGRSSSLLGGSTSNTWQVAAEMAWELDVAGGVRRAEEAANADLQAAEETLRDVRVLVAAEVAFTYVDVRNFQVRLAIAEQNIKIQSESLVLAQQRFTAGASSALDTAQASSNLATTEASVPLLVVGLRRSMHRLGVLLGQNPASLYEDLAVFTRFPVVPDQIAVGIPANLLRQRADLRASERQLAAQTARVGVAVADLYPHFYLPGSAGVGAIEGARFDSGGTTGFWNLGFGFSWNLFDFGRVRNNIDVQEERVNQALLTYEATLLEALEEVENALVSYSREGTRYSALERAVAATQISVGLSGQRYAEGIDDFQQVLDAERSLFALEDSLQISKADHAKALISLYLALGGGWQEAGEPATEQ
ncbi:MAG: NodT family efflux transporter outer membrane factor (OMF) lipoprotein [Candidatus Paceibacteria bacterium]|jgi:NodT family efflux transporter outer membrane factor (OMF) lipoprotein